MSVARRVTRNSLFLVAGEIFFILFSVALVIVAARELSQEDFGIYSFAFAFVNLFTVVVVPGYAGIMMREIPRNRDLAHKYFSNSIVQSSIFGIITFALIIAFTFVFSMDEKTRTSIAFLGIYMVFSSLTLIFQTIFRSFEKMEYSAAIRAGNKFLVALFGIAALLFGYGIYGLSLGFAVAGIISFVTSFFLHRAFFSFGIFGQLDFAFSKKFLLESLPFAALNFMKSSYSRIGVIFLAALAGPIATSIYSAPQKFLEGLNIIPEMVSIAVYPVMSTQYIENREKLSRTVRVSFKLLLALGLAAGLFASFYSPMLVSFIFPASYAGSAAVLSLFVWAATIIFIKSIFDRLMYVADLQGESVKIQLVVLPVFIVLSYFLTTGMSAQGAAIALLVSNILSLALTAYYCVPLISGKKLLLLDLVLASASMIPAALLLHAYAPLHPA